MTETSLNAPITYTIDALDRIIDVNAAWRDFARENGVDGLAGGVIGTELWGHLADGPARTLYRHLTARARSGREVRFRYRCDTPTQRRTFEMTLIATPQRSVQFSSQLICAEDRSPVALLDPTTPRTDQFIRMCGWCQRVALAPEKWAEVEEAVNMLGLLHRERLPGLTHGMCPDCARNFLSEP